MARCGHNNTLPYWFSKKYISFCSASETPTISNQPYYSLDPSQHSWKYLVYLQYFLKLGLILINNGKCIATVSAGVHLINISLVLFRFTREFQRQTFNLLSLTAPHKVAYLVALFLRLHMTPMIALITHSSVAYLE